MSPVVRDSLCRFEKLLVATWNVNNCLFPLFRSSSEFLRDRPVGRFPDASHLSLNPELEASLTWSSSACWFGHQSLMALCLQNQDIRYRDFVMAWLWVLKARFWWHGIRECMDCKGCTQPVKGTMVCVCLLDKRVLWLAFVPFVNVAVIAMSSGNRSVVPYPRTLEFDS